MAYLHLDNDLSIPMVSCETGSSPGSVLESVVEYQRVPPHVNERSHTNDAKSCFITSTCKKKGDGPPAIYAPDVKLSFENKDMMIRKVEIGRRNFRVKQKVILLVGNSG